MKYSREYIERLLGKFVDGLTTELEEQQLAEYFDTADDIPAEWQVYKEMFRAKTYITCMALGGCCGMCSSSSGIRCYPTMGSFYRQYF